VNTKKENEIPVFRDLLDKIPAEDLKDAVISADALCGRPHNWSYAGMVVMPMPPPGAMPAVVAARTAAA
jgi:hypothetical protein